MVENSGDEDLVLYASPCIACLDPSPRVIIPAHTEVLNPALPFDVSPYVWVESRFASALRMHLRVRDLSREAETYGTEIPIVAQSSFRASIRLIDVPTDPRFRVTLRIYGSVSSANVTVLPPNGTVPLRTFPVALTNGIAQVDPIDASAAATSSVRLVIDAAAPIWAFASVTNNETQDVTTITEMTPPQTLADYQYLLPLAPKKGLAGAGGSIWDTSFVAENSSTHDIVVFHYGCPICLTPPPPGMPFLIPAESTVFDPDVTQNMPIGTAVFAFNGDMDSVRMHLRVRDMSREAETFGTEIPVVPASAYAPSLRLIDVPNDPRFRLTLRIYSLYNQVAARVTVLGASGTTPLVSEVVPLPNSAAELNLLQGVTVADPSLRVVVEGVSATPVWAFISVTNNATQDVTTITESP